jgi:hypothetical protein
VAEACCASSHEPPDTACRNFEAGANGRCVFCDHESKCHPGPGATCEIGSGERGHDAAILAIARNLGAQWRDHEGFNAALLDELAALVGDTKETELDIDSMPALAQAIRTLLAHWPKLPAAKRLAILDELHKGICAGCGADVPPRCHCQNDE